MGSVGCKAVLIVSSGPSVLATLGVYLNNAFRRVLALPHPSATPALLRRRPISVVLLSVGFSLNMGDKRSNLL